MSRYLAIAAALAVAAVPVSASAQAGWLEGWDSGTVTVYGWLPSVSGSQERRDGEPLIDLDTPSVLEMLDFAFFAAGEIRRDRVGLLFDVEYADLNQDGTAERTLRPGADPATGEIGTTLLMATGLVTYRFLEQDGAFLDAYGGLRAYDVETDLSYEVLNSRQSFDADANWVDGVVGLRGRVGLGRGFGLTGLADVGGGIIGESELSWQVTGTLDYAFTDQWVGRLGYRYMRIDYDSSGLSMDLELYGPLLGVTFVF
jgi:opacity protein-like surface antigen